MEGVKSKGGVMLDVAPEELALSADREKKKTVRGRRLCLHFDV